MFYGFRRGLFRTFSVIVFFLIGLRSFPEFFVGFSGKLKKISNLVSTRVFSLKNSLYCVTRFWYISAQFN